MKTIEQTIEFPGVTAEELFETYMDSKKHAAATGVPASIERRVGGDFRKVGDGHLVGTILHLVPNRMIVQTWRAQPQWKESDLDSIVVLTFEQIAGGAKIGLVHSGVPDQEFDLFNQGWHERYWKPWKRYFEKPAQDPLSTPTA